MKLFTFLFILGSLIFTNRANSQNWNQIGITSPSDFTQFFPGDNVLAQIGVVWGVKFEPLYNGSTQKRLFATGVNSGLYLSETGEGTDWILLNTDMLEETAIGDFTINPSNRDEVFIGTGLYKLKFARSNPEFFGGKGFYKGTINAGTISWVQTDQTFLNGASSKTSHDFWNEANSKKFVSKILQENSTTYVAVIIDERTSGSSKSINSYVYKSTNGGITWDRKLEMWDVIANDIDIDPFAGTNILITANYSINNIMTTHFFLSSDFGNTWTGIINNFPDINLTTSYYKTSYSKTQNVIFVCRFDETSDYIFKIDLSVPTISPFVNDIKDHNAGKASAFEMYDDELFVVGSLETIVYVKNSGTYTQTLFTWNDDGVHPDIRDLVFYPNSKNFVIANDGGVTKMTFNNNQYTPTKISSGLTIDRVTKISSYSKNKDIYGYSHWDNAPVFKNKNWENNKFIGLSGNENICFGIGKNQVVAASLLGDNVARYSFDFDAPSFNISWILTLNSTNNVTYNGYLRILKADYFTLNEYQKNIIVVGNVHDNPPNQYTPPNIIAEGIFIVPYFDASTNATKITSNICVKVMDPPPSGKKYIQPRMSINDGNHVYTAYEYGADITGLHSGITLFKSTNAGNNWVQINSIGTYGGGITDIAVDPMNPDQICLASENKLIFWNTTLSNYSSITTNTLSNINTITYVNSNTVLAATDFGVFIYYILPNGASYWIDFQSLLPSGSQTLRNLRISDIEYLTNYNLVRVATMGRGAFECTMPNKCEKINTPLTIDKDLTLNYSQTCNTDIIVSNNSKLIIKGELRMAPDTKITIEEGSKLLIDGGSILNLCDNTTWDGIIAYGNSSLSQSDYLQTKVTLVGATIKNAKSAIHLERGAVLNANSSNFENCHHSISFSNPTHTASLSVINECTFTCNHPIFGYPFESQSDFINLYNIYGVIISGNHFENSIPEGVTTYYYRGKGIYSIDASYKLIPSSSLINISDPNCPVPAGTPNTFVQLSIGIEMANGTLTSNKLDAIQNVFENCGEAIKIKSSIGSRLFMNEIIMSNIYSGKLNHTAYTGISFDNSTDFIAEHNTINMNFTSTNRYYDYVGIIVNNSDMAPLPNLAKSSFIYHNSISITANLNGFTYTSKGLITSNDNTNLQLLCNSFSNLSKGMVLTGKLNNQCMINNIPNAAENSFIGIPNPNDMIDGAGLSIPITYYTNIIPYPGGINITAASALIDKCNNSNYGTLSSYYCTNGNGNINPGDPIVIGDNGDNLGLKKVDVTPNPANTNILITLQNFSDKPLDVTISNSQGINLTTKHFNNLTNINAIDIQSLPEGLYNLKVINNIGEYATCQFIVLRQ